MKFYDTNALLLLLGEAFNEEFLVSTVTFEELEAIKTNKLKDEDTRYKARELTRLLWENKDKYRVFPPFDYKLPSSDLKIIDSVQNAIATIACERNVDLREITDVEFVTHDLSCYNLAKNVYHLKVADVPSEYQDEYTGFKVVNMSDDEMAYFYEHPAENTCDLLVNEYLIIKSKNGEAIDQYVWTGNEHKKIYRKDIKTTYFNKLKPKDVYQDFVVDSILNNTLTAISGKAGSGKSLLAIMTAMYLVEKGYYDRLVVMFNPTKTRGAADMGYYGGDFLDKAMQNSIGQILTTKFGDRCAVDILVQQGKIKLVSMADARGMEILDNEILWITEAQNTSVDLLKLCLSRMSQNAKAIIEGDYNSQVDSKYFEGNNNGLKRIITAFKGYEEFGYIQLQNIWRSRIAELSELL